MDPQVNDLDNPADSSDPGRHVAVVGRSMMNSDYAIIRSRGASSWLLTWTLHGAGRLSHDRVAVEATRHHLVILGPDVCQRYGTWGPHWDFAWFHFQPRPAWLALVRPWEVGPGLYRTTVDTDDDANRVGGSFDRAVRDVRPSRGASDADAHALDDPSNDAGRQTIFVSSVATTELLLNAIEEILLVATRSAGARATETSATERLGRGDVIAEVERVIVAHPSAPHTVASLAASVLMSPSHFAHEFKRRAGRTPMDAVRAERLGLAVQLLRSTDLQVAQVARAVGYPDPYYFSRLFRRHLGVPPSAYAAAAVDNPRYRPE